MGEQSIQAHTQYRVSVGFLNPGETKKAERSTRHVVVHCFPFTGRKNLSCGCFSLLFYLQVAINGANLQNVFMLLTLEPLLARSPFLVLHVRRSNLVGDALRELSIHSDIDLKKPLKVSFPHIFSTFSFSKHFCSLSDIHITASPVCSNFSIAVTHRNILVSARIESFF